MGKVQNKNVFLPRMIRQQNLSITCGDKVTKIMDNLLDNDISHLQLFRQWGWLVCLFFSKKIL